MAQIPRGSIGGKDMAHLFDRLKKIVGPFGLFGKFPAEIAACRGGHAGCPPPRIGSIPADNAAMKFMVSCRVRLFFRISSTSALQVQYVSNYKTVCKLFYVSLYYIYRVGTGLVKLKEASCKLVSG